MRLGFAEVRRSILAANGSLVELVVRERRGLECPGLRAVGDIHHALESLDTAMRLHNPALINLKMFPLLDPLRKEPLFQAIERASKFPE